MAKITADANDSMGKIGTVHDRSIETEMQEGFPELRHERDC